MGCRPNLAAVRVCAIRNRQFPATVLFFALLVGGCGDPPTSAPETASGSLATQPPSNTNATAPASDSEQIATEPPSTPNVRSLDRTSKSVEPVALGPRAPLTAAPETVVVVVREVPEGKWTNGNPPVVTVEIENVLGGQCAEGSAKVLWQPAPCPYELFEYPIETSKRYQWLQDTLDTPKIGKRWILWGELVDGLFVSRGRWEPTEKNVTSARKIAAEQAMNRLFATNPAKRAEAQAKRLATVRPGDIADWAAQSQFVAIGSYYPDQFFNVEEVLKGQLRLYYPKGVAESMIVTADNDLPAKRNRIKSIKVPLPRDRIRLLEKKGRYLLFLSERGMCVSAHCSYAPVGEGVIPLNEEALKATREGAQRPYHRQAAVALSTQWLPREPAGIVTQIDDAILIHVCRFHGVDAKTIRHLKEEVEGLDYFLNLTREPSNNESILLHAQGVSMATSEIVLDEWWQGDTDAELLAKLKEFVKRLVKSE